MRGSLGECARFDAGTIARQPFAQLGLARVARADHHVVPRLRTRSRRTERYYEAEMNQGSPILGSPLTHLDAARFAHALDLRDDELHALPMQVVSTGLPYLIVPVARGLERARIVVDDFEERLARVGAKFVYVFDPDGR